VAATGVREQVATVVLGGPMAVRDERARRDDLAECARVVGERVGEPGRRGRARRGLAERGQTPAERAAVVESDAAEVDLLVRALADVVDEEPVGPGVGIEGEAERVAQTPRVQLLTRRRRSIRRVAAHPAAGRSRTTDRVAGSGITCGW